MTATPTRDIAVQTATEVANLNKKFDAMSAKVDAMHALMLQGQGAAKGGKILFELLRSGVPMAVSVAAFCGVYWPFGK
jgi:hypothetical protein